MKNGKKIKLNNYKNIRLSYGTVDYKNLNSVYLGLKTWITPKNEININKDSTSIRRNIIKYIRNLETELFFNEPIVVIDIKENGVKRDKSSFLDIEITLFTKKDFMLRSNEIRSKIESILKDIIDHQFFDSENYNCKLTKN